MIGTKPAIWRIVYKRSISGKCVYGVKEKQYLQFLDDFKNLSENYVAVLECKELEAGPWNFAAYVIVTDFKMKQLILIDNKGEKLLKIIFTTEDLKDLLTSRPSFNYLKELV